MNKTALTILLYFLIGVLTLTIADYVIFKNFAPVRNIVAGLLASGIYYLLYKKSLVK